MEVISSIYNSGYNIKKFYLGSRELNLAYLGNQVIYDEVIGDNDLNYILYEFYGSDTLPNTVKAPVKSAILNGNTLVNFSPLNGEITLAPGSRQDMKGEFIKSSTTFTISFNCSSVPTTEFIEFRHGYGSFSPKIETIPVVQGYNRFKFTTSASGVNLFSFRNDSKSKTNFIFNNVMILEGDYTNVDIPYFRGMASVKMPVLTTSNKAGTKTNTLTVNEDVTLRSNGDICDELNLLTGQLTQRIGEDGVVLSQEVVKTVDLSSNTVYAYNGTTHYTCSSEEGSLIPTACIEVPVETETVE